MVPAVFCIYFDLFDGLIQTNVFVFLTSLFAGEGIKEDDHRRIPCGPAAIHVFTGGNYYVYRNHCCRSRCSTGFGAGIGIGIATGHASDATARQPEASGKINSTLLLGCAMAEGTAIFGFITALIIIFVG